jgi:hypothetical protein
MSIRRIACFSLFLAVFATGSTVAAELSISPSERTGLAVTVYNGDLALVRDSRRVDLPAGDTALAFADVSTRLKPNTALLQSSNGAFVVREQVFDFDVVSQSSLLQAYVGKEVGVISIHPATGKEIETRATVLAVANGVVLEINGRITTEIPGRLIFDSLPAGVRTQPTLVASIVTKDKTTVDADLSYLTNGLTWRADYVAELSSDSSTLDLSAWATISNTTGTDFPDATLKLVAGDINRAPPQPKMMRAMEMASRGAQMADEVMQESLAAFHLYAIERPVTLADRQTKQLALMSANKIAVRMDLVSRGEGFATLSPLNGQLRSAQATRSLVFKNSIDAGLGAPLPSGTVRVYGQDSTGALQLLGEDGVGHTPTGQDVQFTLGRDFDVTVVREQLEFLRASDRITISAHRLTVSNAKDSPVTVRLVEPMQADWEIIEESAPHAKVQGEPEWTVEVPAGGEVQVNYRARVRL